MQEPASAATTATFVKNQSDSRIHPACQFEHATTRFSPSDVITDCIVIAVCADNQLNEAARNIDEATDAGLQDYISRGLINTDRGVARLLPAPFGIAANRILVIGAGDTGDLQARMLGDLVTKAIRELLAAEIRDALFCLSDLPIPDRSAQWKVREQVTAIEAAAYRYHISAISQEYTLERIQYPDIEDAAVGIAEGRATAAAVNAARKLSDSPANICTPSFLAEAAREIASTSERLRCDVLNEYELSALEMNAFLSVGKGSAEESKLIALHYTGLADDSKNVVLIGKGVTFDTGGTAIKSRVGMRLMKYDMCGAAVVISVMRSIAMLELPINVVALAACAENMPSGTATRPSDVVKSMSGKTIEVLNPDAEGRMLLCDALSYAERFNPEAVIDVATLTGASVVALGHHHSALMANDDELAADLLEAAEDSLDSAWRLPLSEEDLPQLESLYADIANIGDGSAACVVAGLFLSHFSKSLSWAHLDVSGTAKNHGKQPAATGRPANLLLQFLLNRCGR